MLATAREASRGANVVRTKPMTASEWSAWSADGGLRRKSTDPSALSRAAALVCTLALCPLVLGTAARADDPIVGTWIGNVTQPGQDPFETRLTFVSPRGGVSRYPQTPCGGILSGDRKGDAYEFEETISWGGTDEQDPGCIGGLVHVTVDGDKLQYEWTGTLNGEQLAASGELRRQR